MLERGRVNSAKKAADAERLQFAAFYDNAIRNIQTRLVEMEKIVNMDRD